MAVTARAALYCTFLDVIQMILDLSSENINFSQLSGIIVRSGNHVESYIKQADAMINAYLSEAYPTISNWTTTPWATGPIIPVNPNTGTSSNTGTASLLSVAPQATATTGTWIISVSTAGDTTTGRYTLYSYNAGNQGINLKFNEDVTSTNGCVKIEKDAWVDGSISQGGFAVVVDDKFMFSTINTKPLIWMISVTLSTAIALNSIYLGQSQTDSPYGAMFWNRAMYLLDKLAAKQISVEPGLEEFNQLVPTTIKYEIDDVGKDITKRMTDLYGTYKTS